MTGERRESVITSQAKRTPLGRILFLMSNTYVTGSTLTIDGGLSLT